MYELTAFCAQKKPANSFRTGVCVSVCQNDAGRAWYEFYIYVHKWNMYCKMFANDKMRDAVLCALHICNVNWLKHIKLFMEEYRNS